MKEFITHFSPAELINIALSAIVAAPVVCAAFAIMIIMGG